MVNAGEFLRAINNADSVRILKDGKEVYIGFLGTMEKNMRKQMETEQMEKFRAVPELRHKKYKELGLMEPIEPDKMPEYSFSDLRMTLYYTIILEGQKENIEGKEEQ